MNTAAWILLASLLALSVLAQNNETNSSNNSSENADPDISRTFQQIVEQNGFLFEEHTVTTKDGYILKLFRIPGSNSSPARKGKKVVYFQHGLLDSADCWIMHKASVAPAFVASRAGYDVWLGNSRGNKYSHSYNGQISNYNYWNYDFENMGDFDITDEIDYALSITGEAKVAYIGHSQGTTQMFYSLAYNEDFFAQRVSVFIALAPVIELQHCKSTLINMFAVTRALIVDTCSVLGIYEFFPANWLTTGAMRLLCGTIPSFCELGLFLVTDEDPTLNDQDRTAVYLGHFPSGTSMRTLDHYGQLITGKAFDRYNFGSSENQKKYNSTTPPVIPIDTISKVPIAMFVGTKDQLGTLEDNRWAKSVLKTVAFYKEYELGHMSFLIAKDYSFFTTDAMNIVTQYHPIQSTIENNLFLTE